MTGTGAHVDGSPGVPSPLDHDGTRHQIKTLLVNPPQIFTRNHVASGITPPLGIAYLAAYLLEHDRPVQVIDALGEDPTQVRRFRGNALLRGLSFDEIVSRVEPDVGLIGVSNLFSFAAPVVEELCAVLRENLPDVPIVVGGHHSAAWAPHILEHQPAIDFVARGEEGEEALLGLVHHLEGCGDLDDLVGLAHRDAAGRFTESDAADRILNLDRKVRLVGRRPGGEETARPGTPFPARHLLPIENYVQVQEAHGPASGRWTSILSSRGCPYGCTFCSSRRTRFVARSATDVVDEMEHCIAEWGIEEFHFEDDNMTMDQDRLVEICDEIIRRDLQIRWQTPNGIRASRTTREMLAKMQASGCRHVTLAPESGSPRVLRDIIKKGNDFSLEQIERCGADAHDLGMKVAAYFIIGLPRETTDDVRMTIDFARRLARVGVDEVAFALFTPLPGTPLWDEVHTEGDEVDWLELLAIDDLGHAASWNDQISDRDLQRLRTRAYLTFQLTRLRYHPRAFVRTLLNVARDIEETKTERALRSLLDRWGLRRKRFSPGSPSESVAPPDAGAAGAYPYDGAGTLRVLLRQVPRYAYTDSLMKTVRLLSPRTRRQSRSTGR